MIPSPPMVISTGLLNQATTSSRGDCVFLLKPLFQYRLRADIFGSLGQRSALRHHALRAARCTTPRLCRSLHTPSRMAHHIATDFAHDCLPLVWQMATSHARCEKLAYPSKTSSHPNRCYCRSAKPTSFGRSLPHLPLSCLCLPKLLPNSCLQIKIPPFNGLACLHQTTA